MSLLVDTIYASVAVLSSPYWAFRAAISPRFRQSLGARLGRGPVHPRPDGARRVWIHCASVGELNAARTFIDALPRRLPGFDWVVSTCSDTGREQAAKRYGADRVFLFPIELSWIARGLMRRVDPDALVIVESEIWPNTLEAARRAGVPVLWINGRLQPRALRRWRPWRRLLGFGLDEAARNVYCIQTAVCAARFRELGVPLDRIRVTGNMKYDAVRTEISPSECDKLRLGLGLAPEAPVIVGGSTWPGEEEALLAAYARLRERVPGLRLILAPRHVERADDVERVIRRAGLDCLRRSRGDAPTGGEAVVLLDTIGELATVYALASCAFVGKTLFVGGGHNVLEPAALGVPVVFGPLTANCEEEAAMLAAAGAGRRVADGVELGEALDQLLTDKELRRTMGARGRKAVRRNQGATERNMEALAGVLAADSRISEEKGAL